MRPGAVTVLVGLGLLLLALAPRLYRLDGQSLWYDEGVSAHMTTRGAAEIWAAAAADIHPPLYYWLLSAWAIPFGSGELALRGFSVLCGTLAVLVTWRLGRSLYDGPTGVLGAAFLALSPLAVQYGQEVRMYALASLLAAAATLAYVSLARALLADPADTPRGANRRRAALATLYGLSAAALMYTHYYGLLVVAAHQVLFGVSALIMRRWSALPGWLLGNGLAALLYLPWLPHALRQTGYYPGLGTPQSVGALLLDMVNVLSIGVATTRFAFRPGLAPFVLLAGLGLLARSLTQPDAVGRGHPNPSPSNLGGRLAPQDWGVGGPLLILWLLVPIVGILILSRTRPLYEPRFLMLVAPAWALLLGAGLALLWRTTVRSLGGGLSGRAAGAAGPDARRGALPPALRGAAAGALVAGVLALMLVPIARSLGSYYFDPVYARDDYRGLARRVMLAEGPADAVVLTAPGQAEIFGYYYRGRSDVFPLPAQRPIDAADTRTRLESLAADHRRVWLVRWAANEADPEDVILRWLEAHGQPAGGERFGRVELRLYDLGASA